MIPTEQRGTAPRGHRAGHILALLSLYFLAPRPASAGVTGEAGGFAELRFSGMPGVDGTWWQLTERFRPRFQANLHERVSLFAELELGFAQGRDSGTELQRLVEDSDFGPLLDLGNCTWPSHENGILRIDGVGDYLDVSRLYLDLYLPGVDLRLGRQALYWGSAALINPTDPFPELLVGEPWKPRRGTNALRANVPIGEASDLTAVLATSDTFDALRAATRWRLRIGSADLAFVAAWRGDDEDGLIGVDLRGTAGVGYWIEASLHLDAAVHGELAVGIDYSFPVLDGLMVMAQYYRNEAGAGPGETPSPALASIEGPTCDLPEGVTLPEGSSPLFGGVPAEKAPVFAPLLSGRDYLVLMVSQVFLPELSLSLTALQNLDDGTGFFVPTVTASPSGWLQLSLSAQVPYRLWGEGGEFKPADDDLRIATDLGFMGHYEADLSGLVPDATITFWTRASF